jgi:PEGA domain-containing protein
LQENEARNAQLVAAAEALVTWIHARQRTWPDLPTPPRHSQLNATASATPELAPIADAIRPLQSIPSVTSVAPVEWDEAPAVIEPPVRGNWRQRIAGAARGLATVIPVLGAVLRAIVGALLVVARWLSGVVRRPRRRTRQRVRQSRRGPAYAAVAGILLVTGWLGRPYWTTIVEPLSQTASVAPPVEQKALSTTSGQLMVRSDPSGARVSVDGNLLGVTPLDIDDLSIGAHTVLIEAAQGSLRRTVSISADRPTVVNESIYAGFLKVFAPFELRITAGNRAIRLDDQNQVMLPPGSYQLQLENAALGYQETRRVDVIPGQTSTLSIVPPPSSLTVTANVPAVVSVDGQLIGATPLTEHPIALGTRDILVRSESGQEKRFTPRVTVAPLQLSVEF